MTIKKNGIKTYLEHLIPTTSKIIKLVLVIYNTYNSFN